MFSSEAGSTADGHWDKQTARAGKTYQQAPHLTENLCGIRSERYQGNVPFPEK
jgi:hypothetical protein